MPVNRRKYPEAVKFGRTEHTIKKGRKTLNDFGPTSSQERMYPLQNGLIKTKSRFPGGKKSTTAFNVKVGKRTATGGYKAVKVRRHKQVW